jgi:hypothetical protein
MKTFLEIGTKLILSNSSGVLRGIHIDHGVCTISNGILSAIAYFPELSDVTCTVDAKKFASACSGANYAAVFKQTEKQLAVFGNKFRAKLTLMEGEYPNFRVTGESVDLPEGTFAALKLLLPFASTDASRRWACSILFDTRHAYATNNIIAARIRLATPRSFAVPTATIAALLRYDSDVLKTAITGHSVRFDLRCGVSLHSVLVQDAWPDVARFITPSNTQPIPSDMRKGLEALVPLCSGMLIPQIVLDNDGMHVEANDAQARYSSASFPLSRFHAEPLLAVLKVADEIDLTSYPKPCYFKGNNIEGVVVGLLA